MALTEREIAALQPRATPYQVADGNALFIRVAPTGSKLYRLRYRHNGVEKALALGQWPKTKLADARRAAAEARDAIAEGRDPSHERQIEKQQKRVGAANTFKAVADLWKQKVAVKLAASTKEKHEGFLSNWVLPAFGSVPISDIRPADIVAMVQKAERAGVVEVPGRLFAFTSRILAYGVATGLSERNPATDIKVGDLLHRPPAKHRAALLDGPAIGAALRAIDGYEGSKIVRAYLMLLPLLFPRPGELRCAFWSQFDLEKAEWRFTSSKTGIDMVVALPPQAVAILVELNAVTGGGVHLFPNARHKDRPMSDNAANAALRAMGFDTRADLTCHGWRATARTRLVEELEYDPSIVEMQLGHVVRDANGTAYNRTKFLDKRRQMMAAWATHLDELRRLK